MVNSIDTIDPEDNISRDKHLAKTAVVLGCYRHIRVQ